MKMLLILLIPALVAFAALNTDGGEVQPGTMRFLGGIILLTLIWAIFQAKRFRDRTPQVVIDQNGVLARHWHAGIVPWQNIEFIAHSSTIRRGIIQQLARSRRGAYIQFRFREPPPFVGTAPFPFNIVQRLRASFEVQEPAIMEHGLDTSVTVMMDSIQRHIDAWAATQPADTETPA